MALLSRRPLLLFYDSRIEAIRRPEMAEQPSAAAAPPKRIFLTLADGSPEMPRALRYACMRARSIGGAVALLYVHEPSGDMHWFGVNDVMRAERRKRRSGCCTASAPK